ncbi:MAG TPA: hypothetical protein VFD57_02330 [Clostridia bacterium]|nr:hypothetical protein [Clostridia bacterium]
MWVVVYMAHSKKVAHIIENILNSEGILLKLKPVYKNVASEENCYEILVPQSEGIEARAILMENGY